MSSTGNHLDDFRQAFERMGVEAAGDRLKIIIGIDYGTTFSGKISWICRIYLTCYRYQLCHFRQDWCGRHQHHYNLAWAWKR